MKTLGQHPLLFFRVCWNHGIHQALRMAFDKVTLYRFVRKVKFPHVPQSNATSYLHVLKIRPQISVIVPVFNSRWLAETIASVQQQSYDNWELILVDDGAPAPEIRRALEAAARESRVRVLRNPRNLGISGATNAGIQAGTGEYIAFLDHDDLLHHDALAQFVRALNDGRQADVYYTDEVRIDEEGYIIGPTRKCQLSLDLLLSCNAVCHLCIMRKTALLKIGLLKSEYDGAQDHELMLRAWEQGLTFCHLPFLLYGWRMHRASSSDGTRSAAPAAGDSRPQAYRSGKAMLQAYLDRNKIKAAVTDDGFPWYRVKYALPATPDEVTIIVPFRDQVHHLKTLLQSIRQTTYPRYRLVLVNNGSREPETREYLAGLWPDARLEIIDFDEPFNYSRINNAAVQRVTGGLLLFLNNDIEVIRPDWLEALLEHIYRPGVGAVGGKLIRPDGTIQHAGIAFKPSIFYCAENLTDPEEFYTRVQRDVTGVTAACMLIRRSVFQQVGGFDEVHFPIGFSDADLCLRIVQAGHKIIYTPFAVLCHHESRSRSFQEEEYEMRALFDRYIGATPLADRHYHATFLG